MAYLQHQPNVPSVKPRQKLTMKAAEAGKMGGVTPEIWDDILQQLQQLINENESLRKTLEANNRQMQEIIEKKNNETTSAQKLYWDVRVSVLGFKSQIMKLTGERDQLLDKRRKETDTSHTSDVKKELSELRETISQLQRKNQELVTERDTSVQEKANLDKKYRKTLQDYQDNAHHWKAQELSELRETINQLQRKNRELTDSHTSKELAELRETINQLQRKNRELITERSTSVQEKDEKYRRRLQECQDSAHHWKEQFDVAKRDFERERATREEEAKKVDALRRDRESLQREVVELRRKVTEQHSPIARIDPNRAGPRPQAPMIGEESTGYTVSHSHQLERERPRMERRESRTDEQGYRPSSPTGGYHKPPQPLNTYPAAAPGRHVARPNDQYPPNQFRQDDYRRPPVHEEHGYRRPSDDHYRYPNEPYRPSNFSAGGGTFTAPTHRSDNDFMPHGRIRQTSGGGELVGEQFKPSHRAVTVPDRGQAQPWSQREGNQFPSSQSGMTPVRRRLPPDHGVVLPGDVHNAAKPAGQCPICGLDNFASQTDLEMHAAKCDKFN